MKVAVIGSGISGLSAAYLLSQEHEVTLYEKEERLGGHSHTIDVTFGKKRIPVDTGFMVYNPLQYPHLVKLFKHLDIETIYTNMSFSVSVNDGLFEFSSNFPTGIFADRVNVLRISFYQFLLEIHRFNKVARVALKKELSEEETLSHFLKRHKFSDDLMHRYILPMVGSIWSTPKKMAHDFPIGALLKFLHNHQLLQEVNQPRWNTVKGGSREYVERMEKEMDKRGVSIRKGEPVSKVLRSQDSVTVFSLGKKSVFDYAVLASHADETLAMLGDATPLEHKLLSKFSYEKNSVIVHSDPRLMPRRKQAWTAWNYLEKSTAHTEKVTLTYWMNLLQSIDKKYPIFITLNPYLQPEHGLVHAKFNYSHPQYTVNAVKAQKELDSLQNKKRTLFCGAYFGYGFHEDGIESAIRAVKHLGVKPPWKS